MEQIRLDMLKHENDYFQQSIQIKIYFKVATNQIIRYFVQSII